MSSKQSKTESKNDILIKKTLLRVNVISQEILQIKKDLEDMLKNNPDLEEELEMLSSSEDKKSSDEDETIKKSKSKKSDETKKSKSKKSDDDAEDDEEITKSTSKKSNSRKSSGPTISSLKEKAKQLDIKGYNTMNKTQLEFALKNPSIAFNKKKLTLFLERFDEYKEEKPVMLIKDDEGMRLQIGEYKFFVDKCKVEDKDKYDGNICNKMFSGDVCKKLKCETMREKLKECDTYIYIVKINDKLKFMSSLE